MLLCWGSEAGDVVRHGETAPFGEPYFPVCLGVHEAPQTGLFEWRGHTGRGKAAPQGAMLNKRACLHVHLL